MTQFFKLNCNTATVHGCYYVTASRILEEECGVQRLTLCFEYIIATPPPPPPKNKIQRIENLCVQFKETAGALS